jgi:hypothetical protein
MTLRVQGNKRQTPTQTQLKGSSREMPVRSADPSMALIVVVLPKLKQAVSWLYPTRNSFAQDGGCDWKNHLRRILPGRFGLMYPTRSLTLRYLLTDFRQPVRTGRLGERTDNCAYP